jgi:UDPglucose 6-dehydrogenase
MKQNKICIIGAGYVGVSLACILDARNNVCILEIDEEKIASINSSQSPIPNQSISNFFLKGDVSLVATNDPKIAFHNANYFIIALPTNFDEITQSFDTSLVSQAIESILELTSNGLIVIKSTVPSGFTRKVRKRFHSNRIIFSPEFLREGSALEDNLYPSRIIVGDESVLSQDFLELMEQASLNTPTISKLMPSEEAETVKLFSNTFLAMRIAFFNELDSFAMANSLNSANVIEGVSADNRIGDYYNNPSFGYGGYCLPKDTKQLVKSYEGVPQTLMNAIVSSNTTRIKLIADTIIQKKPNKVGIYKLSMKKGSLNSRSSSIIGVIELLRKSSINIIIYEPFISDIPESLGVLELNLSTFKQTVDIIVCNRFADELADVRHKVFSRDVFNRD